MKQSHIREKLINYLNSHKGYDTLDSNIQKLKDAFPALQALRLFSPSMKMALSIRPSSLTKALNQPQTSHFNSTKNQSQAF